jgi:hypothetical protein
LQRLIADLRRVDTSRTPSESWDEIWPWLRRHGRLARTAALVLLFALMPAASDRLRHRAAWDILSHADQSGEEYGRAARHFERQVADQPFDAETNAGLDLAHLRTGTGAEPAGVAQSWSRDIDEWSAVRKLAQILAEVKLNHRDGARASFHAARSAGYLPRTDVERRLWDECERGFGE